MSPCRQRQIESGLVRLLAAAAAGGAIWVAAEPIARHFNTVISDTPRLLVSCAVALACWLITRRAFEFTYDCLDVPSGAPAPAFVSAGERQCTTGACSLRSPHAVLSMDANQQVFGGQSLLIQITRGQAGSFDVIATATGFSNSKFDGNDGPRKGLEAIRAVSWSAPARLPDGKRRMQGTVAAGADEATLLSSLQSLADKHN